MSRPAVEQVRLVHRGRQFHFVSYEGRPGNPKKNQPATGPAWFLMSAGTRWEVMPHQPYQEPEELNRQFTAWLEQHVFAPAT